MRRSYELISFNDNSSMRVLMQVANQYRIHSHRPTEIMYMLRGRILLGLQGQSFPLQEGRFVVINSMALHFTYRPTDEKSVLLVIQIDDAKFREMIGGRIDSAALLKAQEHDSSLADCASSLLRVAAEFNKRADAYLTRAQELVRGFFSTLRARGFYMDDTGTPESDTADNDRIASILSYADNHLKEDISLQHLAENEHISYFYLSHCNYSVLP